jgi:hypothetical protein
MNVDTAVALFPVSYKPAWCWWKISENSQCIEKINLFMFLQRLHLYETIRIHDFIYLCESDFYFEMNVHKKAPDVATAAVSTSELCDVLTHHKLCNESWLVFRKRRETFLVSCHVMCRLCSYLDTSFGPSNYFLHVYKV